MDEAAVSQYRRLLGLGYDYIRVQQQRESDIWKILRGFGVGVLTFAMVYFHMITHYHASSAVIMVFIPLGIAIVVIAATTLCKGIRCVLALCLPQCGTLFGRLVLGSVASWFSISGSMLNISFNSSEISRLVICVLERAGQQLKIVTTTTNAIFKEFEKYFEGTVMEISKITKGFQNTVVEPVQAGLNVIASGLDKVADAARAAEADCYGAINPGLSSCKKAANDGYASCMKSLPPFLNDALCHVVFTIDDICGGLQQIDVCSSFSVISGIVTDPLKEIGKTLMKQFEFSIDKSFGVSFSANAEEVIKDYASAARESFNNLLAVVNSGILSWNVVMTIAFLAIPIGAAMARRKVLKDSKKYSLYMVKKVMKPVKPSLWTLFRKKVFSSGGKKSRKFTSKLFHATIATSISLFLHLGLVAVDQFIYAALQSATPSNEVKIKWNVTTTSHGEFKGGDSIMALLNRFLKFPNFNGDYAFDADMTGCLPHPRPPHGVGAVLMIIFAHLLIFLTYVWEDQLWRLRASIVASYYPNSMINYWNYRKFYKYARARKEFYEFEKMFRKERQNLEKIQEAEMFAEKEMLKFSEEESKRIAAACDGNLPSRAGIQRGSLRGASSLGNLNEIPAMNYFGDRSEFQEVEPVSERSGFFGKCRDFLAPDDQPIQRLASVSHSGKGKIVDPADAFGEP